MYEKCFNVSKKWQNYKFVISKLICREFQFFYLEWNFFVIFFCSFWSQFVFVVFSFSHSFHTQATFMIGWNLSNEREKIFKRQCKMSFECHTIFIQYEACEKKIKNGSAFPLYSTNNFLLLFPTLAFKKNY